MKKFVIFVFALLTCCQLPSFALDNPENTLGMQQNRTEIINSNSDQMSIRFNLDGLNTNTIEVNGASRVDFSIVGESLTQTPGDPSLPAVSRWIIVPGNKTVEVFITEDPKRVTRSTAPPVITDEDVSGSMMSQVNQGLYPPQAVVVGSPVRMRNLNLVQVTVYPVQYDFESQNYIERTNLDIDLRFRDTDNNVIRDFSDNFQRTPSPDFQRLIESMVLNPPLHRDDAELIAERGYNDYYLFVAPDSISGEYRDEIRHMIYRLVEWKRRAGNKVEVQWVPAGQEQNPAQIKALVQERYNELAASGVDPFDNILLIGEEDRPGGGDTGGRGSDVILYSQQNANIELPQWRGHWDLWYSYLEGDEGDMIPDVAISRFHAGNAPMMANGINKTLSYQSEPYMEDDAWFTEAIVQQEHILNGYGTEVFTVDYFIQALEHNDKHVVGDWRGDDENARQWLADQINQGVGFVAGRAQNAHSTYHQGNHPNALFEAVNIYPVAIHNSGHGEWAMESFFWVGREYYNDHPERFDDASGAKGMVASTCTWTDPATTPNNALGIGMVHAMLDLRMSFGWARNWTIMNLARVYPGDDDIFEKYSVDFQLCGDTGLRQWEGVPAMIELQYPAELPPGATHVPVRVIDPVSESGVGDILVTLYQGEMDNVELYDLLVTDAEGYCDFILSPELEGAIFITATAPDVYPFKGEIAISETGLFVQGSITDINDTGNGDGEANPGETLVLSFSAENLGNQSSAANVVGTVTSGSGYVDIEENQIVLGNIDPGESVNSDNTASIMVSGMVPDGERLLLYLDLTGDNGSWRSAFEVIPQASMLQATDLPDEGTISVGDNDFNLHLENIGSISSPVFAASLVSMDWGIRVIDGEAQYGSLEPEESSAPDQAFRLSGHESAIPGMRVPMLLTLESEGGRIEMIKFSLTVGEPGEGDPLGPDKYGYFAFDDTDVEYDQSPEYQWIAISTREEYDYEGEILEITNGNANNGWGVVDLPFTFRYYGTDYDQITVSTDGAIAMGADEFAISNPQNWPLDGGGSGGMYGMIAPLWDNLSFEHNDGDILTVYGSDEGIFIIEWYRGRYTGLVGTEITFQVILYDPAVYPTATMDGAFKFQYKQNEFVLHPSNGGFAADTPWASVGISNPDATDGLSYYAANTGDVTSAPLASERTIYFTTTARDMRGALRGTVMDSNNRQPIANALVVTMQLDSAWTNDAGMFVIENAFAEVPIWVKVTSDDFFDTTFSEIKIPEDGELEVEFLMHTSVDVADGGEILPRQFELNEIYPNPFNSMSTIRFSLDLAREISLDIFDLNGRHVLTLLEGNQNPGQHNIIWNAENLPTGLYLVRLESENTFMTRKVALIR